MCNACSRPFIGDHALNYKGVHFNTITLITRMLVSGCGLRAISVILGISLGKVLKTLERQQVDLQLKRSFYDKPEVDEFRTYVGKKSHKKWFIFSPKHVCANLRESREPVAWVLGKRNEKTVSALWFKIKAPGIK